MAQVEAPQALSRSEPASEPPERALALLSLQVDTGLAAPSRRSGHPLESARARATISHHYACLVLPLRRALTAEGRRPEQAARACTSWPQPRTLSKLPFRSVCLGRRCLRSVPSDLI